MYVTVVTERRYVPMPRVTNDEYYGRYISLYYAWHRFGNLYRILSRQEQLDVFCYYLPFSPLTKKEILTHRGIMDQKEPELAAKAGRLYAKLTRVFEGSLKGTNGDIDRFNAALRPFIHPDNATVSSRPKRKPRGKLKSVEAQAELRKEPDWDRYAYATLQFVKQKRERGG
jgi:hypothetical protein